MQIFRRTDQVKVLNRNGMVSSGAINYTVSGVTPSPDADNTVLQAVRAAAPERLDAAVRDTVELLRYHGKGVYSVRVNYVLKTVGGSDDNRLLRRAGDCFWSFTAASHPEKKYHTELEPIPHTPDDAHLSADLPGRAINWNGKYGVDRRVDGVAVWQPEFTANCRKYISANTFGVQLRRRYAELVGKVNASAFAGWGAQEALLLKFSASEPFENDQGRELLELEFQFAIAFNRSAATWYGIELGDVSGWEYVWGTTTPDPETGELLPRCAYVSTLYPSADFSTLNLE